MRKLAHVERIAWLRPIEGADKIELAGVLGWQCIVKKNEFKVGDLAIYVEIDSVLPSENPDFAFLESKHYKIKTLKMRGVISQGILFPLSILHDNELHTIGEDVTEKLKIKQSEDEFQKLQEKDVITKVRQRHKKLFKNKLFLWLLKFNFIKNITCKLLAPKNNPKTFPDWIIKTDEIRIQNMPSVLEDYKNVSMIVTEKLDGTSTSFGLRKLGKRKFDFAVCSRNVRQADINQKSYYEYNVYHQIANTYNIRNVLIELQKKYNASAVVLQGETIGDLIQNNKYGLEGIDFYAFNLFVDGKKIDSTSACDIMRSYGIKWVPILDTEFQLLSTVEEMIAYADGKSVISDTLREGVVIRDRNNNISFKCISNKFLLKHNL